MTSVREIDRHSPEAQPAIAEINSILGFDIRVVLNDSWWAVMAIDGAAPAVTVNESGMRCLATFSPLPDAAARCERIIADIKGQL